MSDELQHANKVRVERLAGIGRSYELSDLDGNRVTVVTHRRRVDLIIRSSDRRGLEVVATLSDEQARLLALSLCRVYELSVFRRVAEAMRHRRSDHWRSPRCSRWTPGQVTRP